MTFNRLFWLAALLVLPLLRGQAQVQYVTIRPPVDEIHDTDVSIRRVELTPDYTVLYMTFENKVSGKKPKQPYRLPFPLDQSDGNYTVNASTIQFEPTARLYANRGDVSYKFIKAENIPTRDRIDVTEGKRVDFVAYFERLDPGVTVFDLFECSDQAGNICFNFYGIHVTNPLKKTKTAAKSVSVKAKVSPTVKSAPTKAKIPPVVKPGPTKPRTPLAAKPAKPIVPTRPPATPAAPAITTVAIQGTVRDAKTQKPVGAALAYQRVSGKTADAAENARADAQTGDYRAVVKPAAVYVVTITAKGYFSKVDTLATSRVDVLRDLTLTPIEKGAKLTLQNIEFDLGKYDLRPQSYPELNRLVQLMRDNPTLKIRLEGHTDVVGDFDANLALSRNRVKEVQAYLVRKEIDASRIETMGYGSSRPITRKNAQQNRRVELVIVES
ncbi:MAG: OmpA family protein [Bacteroidetes bacterium]|nr:OmpA family protein [Fibrella sp.]